MAPPSIFLSYSHFDRDAAQLLAIALRDAGLTVWADEWPIVGGDSPTGRLRSGLNEADLALILISRSAVRSEIWTRDLAAATTGDRLVDESIIPVLIDNVPIPLFAASGTYIDLRDATDLNRISSVVDQALRVIEMASPTRQKPNSRPSVAIESARSEPANLILRISSDGAALNYAGRRISQAPPGDTEDALLNTALRELDYQRKRGLDRRIQPYGSAMNEDLQAALEAALVESGKALWHRFLSGPVGLALSEIIQDVAEQNARQLNLGIQIEDANLALLPWETLTQPDKVDRPLILTNSIDAYRLAPNVVIRSNRTIPGPLRILVAIASPERGGYPLLDYEEELRQILSMVEESRSAGRAEVRILEWATPSAIRTALLEGKYHILHLSCIASADLLVLESENGEPAYLSPKELAFNVLSQIDMPPLIVLAGSYTALPDRSMRDPDDGAINGFAWELLRAGAPSVVTMAANVTGRYATDICANLYAELSRKKDATVVSELSRARRQLEEYRIRKGSTESSNSAAEWATAVAYQAALPVPLVEWDAAPTSRRRQEPKQRGIALPGSILRTGTFVGRRAELRTILRQLSRGQHGILILGPAGIGKSALAAEVIDHDVREAIVVPIVGETRVDQIIQNIRHEILRYSLRSELGETSTLRKVAAFLADPSLPWQSRLELIRASVLPVVPVILLLDQVEQYLQNNDGNSWTLRDDELAAFLIEWLRHENAQLLATSRRDFQLAEAAHRKLARHVLGPLSGGEMRKLFWRLPSLDRLGPVEKDIVYKQIGGHPRSLEYLDLLLREGGSAQLPKVSARLEELAAAASDGQGQTSYASRDGTDLDSALSDTVDAAINDMLLDTIVAQLSPNEFPVELLRKSSVYRLPFDDIALAWQVAELQSDILSDADSARKRCANELLLRMSSEGLGPGAAGYDPNANEEWRYEWEEARQPPLEIDDRLIAARESLVSAGLLSRLSAADDDDRHTSHYIVQRWSAGSLARQLDSATQIDAHRRAASYWQWRVRVWPQDSLVQVQQLLEARFHLQQGGDVDDATTLTLELCKQLHTWGSLSWERDLCIETLGWVSQSSRQAALLYFQLGLIARRQGEYNDAEQFFARALDVLARLGDEADMAALHHQLGIVAQMRGDLRVAEERYHAALEISARLGSRDGSASTLHQLGRVAEIAGRFDEAETRYAQALAGFRDIDDRSGMAATYHQIGNLLQRRRLYDEAEHNYSLALEIFEDSNDRERIAAGYHQLGSVAQARGRFDEAEARYFHALRISEELDDNRGVLMAHWNLGTLAESRHRLDEAERRYLVALRIAEEIGDAESIVRTYLHLGGVAEAKVQFEQARERFEAARALAERSDLPELLAESNSNLGVVRLREGRPEDGVIPSVTALALRSQSGSGDFAVDIWSLVQQRDEVGVERFLTIVSKVLDKDSAVALMSVLDTESTSRPPEQL